MELELLESQLGAYKIGMNTIQPTPRTRVRRLPERGMYEREAIYAILDEALVLHLGFEVHGQSFVIPTTFVRVGDALYVHGAASSRTIEVGEAGVPLCATVTLIDGLVFARSAFHHSMNYRSVVVLGRATAVTDPDEKTRALCALVDRFAAGRSAQVRGPSALELKATKLLRLPLDEASAKIRRGPPLDDDEDMVQPCWAGVVPLRMAAGMPIADAGKAGAAAGAVDYESPTLPGALRL